MEDLIINVARHTCGRVVAELGPQVSIRMYVTQSKNRDLRDADHLFGRRCGYPELGSFSRDHREDAVHRGAAYD
jgi:hypothetical protein